MVGSLPSDDDDDDGGWDDGVSLVVAVPPMLPLPLTSVLLLPLPFSLFPTNACLRLSSYSLLVVVKVRV